jgi:hypothetical protein
MALAGVAVLGFFACLSMAVAVAVRLADQAVSMLRPRHGSLCQDLDHRDRDRRDRSSARAVPWRTALPASSASKITVLRSDGRPELWTRRRRC